jgi:hypothetical protein
MSLSTRKYFRAVIGCLLQLSILAAAAHASPAQDADESELDLSDLSIEELMGIHVSSMQGVLGGTSTTRASARTR